MLLESPAFRRGRMSMVLACRGFRIYAKWMRGQKVAQKIEFQMVWAVHMHGFAIYGTASTPREATVGILTRGCGKFALKELWKAINAESLAFPD
jgi:hypothetical protein